MSRIVIVDTGVDLFNPYFKNIKNLKGIAIQKKDDLNFQITKQDENELCIHDDVGHGSAVAGIIFSHNSNVELFIVKMFSQKSLTPNEDLLIFTLEYILLNVEFDILNLSLGVLAVSADDRLESVCNKYYDANKIIVAAFENGGSISFPAAYKNVIGVTNGDGCFRANSYYTTDNDVINICAYGRMQKVYWKNDSQIVSAGNSYASAHFTGILSNIENLNRQNLIQFIEKNSIGKIKINNLSITHPNPINKYKKAVAFPFNKEIHSLVRFSSELSFELVDIFDVRHSARIGASTNALLNEECAKNFFIKNIETIVWDDFDTFILGHTEEYMVTPVLKKIREDLISHILINNKNLYTFDDINSNIDGIKKYKDNNIFFPHVNDNMKNQAPFGKLHHQDKPVVGIFGTTSRQGKFTLQLKLRYELLHRGYNICQLGTEPSSLLYGMDIVFPSGYNSSVDLNLYDTVAYLNKLLYKHSRHSDLIIVGGQSGLIPGAEGNLGYYNFSQLDLLYATLPDIVILCINSFDEIGIINRSIKFIEAATDCQVIALVLYPFCYEGSLLKYRTVS